LHVTISSTLSIIIQTPGWPLLAVCVLASRKRRAGQPPRIARSLRCPAAFCTHGERSVTATLPAMTQTPPGTAPDSQSAADAQRDGKMAAMQIVRDALVGKPDAAFDSFATLSPGEMLHALGFLAGHYVSMCRLYAHLRMVAEDVDEELLRTMATSTHPKLTGPVDDAVRAMIEENIASQILDGQPGAT
jgi:hypothetical protein